MSSVIFSDYTNKQYQAIDAISRSMISDLRKGTLDYYSYHVSKECAKEQTQAMIFGSLVHTLILEPENFEKDFAVKNKVDGRTNAGKEYNEYFAKQHSDKMIIDPESYLKAQDMRNAVVMHPKYQSLMQESELFIENSIIWDCEETGIKFKARPDIYNNSLGILCDVKTCNLGGFNDFSHEVMKRDYNIQAAMQVDAIKNIFNKEIKSFFFLVIPKERPHYPYIYAIDEDLIEHGRQEYKSAAKIIKECQRTGKWGAEREAVTRINLSNYALTTNRFSNLMEKYNVE